MGEFGFTQCVRKLPENEGKVLFDETHFEESNVIGKPLIFSQDKIIMKFKKQKKRTILVLVKFTNTV